VATMDEQIKKSLEDQNTLREAMELIRSKSKDRPMFNALTESLRRKIAKKLIYENVTDEQFLSIREQVIAECQLRNKPAPVEPAPLNESVTPPASNESLKIKFGGK